MKKSLILAGLTITMGAVVCFAQANQGHEECDPRPDTLQNNCTRGPTSLCSGGCSKLVYTGCNDCNEGSATCGAPAGACTVQAYRTAQCVTAGNASAGAPACSCDDTTWTPVGKAGPANNYCS